MNRDTAQQASGRWTWILREIGVPESYLTGYHGPCPKCGGNDRFRYTNYRNNGDYFCNGCGPGDGFDLIMAHLNCDFKTAAKMVDDLLKDGDPKVEDNIFPERANIRERRKMLNTLWVSGNSPSVYTRYLLERGIPIGKLPKGWDCDLRGTNSSWLKEAESRRPAMLALIRNKNGSPVSIHRTFVRDGIKKVMPPTENILGAAIYFGDPEEATKLLIGEGIETVLSMLQYCNEDWCGVATVNASSMEAYDPPVRPNRVIILADNDASFTGQKAAFKLAREMDQRQVSTTVWMPRERDCDFNDCIRKPSIGKLMFSNDRV